MNKNIKNLGKTVLGLTTLAALLYVNPINAKENSANKNPRPRKCISYSSVGGTKEKAFKINNAQGEPVLHKGSLLVHLVKNSMLFVVIDGCKYEIHETSGNDKPDSAKVLQDKKHYATQGQLATENKYGDFYRRIRDGVIKEYADNLIRILNNEEEPEHLTIDNTSYNYFSAEDEEIINIFATDKNGTRYSFCANLSDKSVRDFKVENKIDRISIDIQNNYSKDVQGLLVGIIDSAIGYKEKEKESQSQRHDQIQQEILEQFGY